MTLLPSHQFPYYVETAIVPIHLFFSSTSHHTVLRTTDNPSSPDPPHHRALPPQLSSPDYGDGPRPAHVLPDLPASSSSLRFLHQPTPKRGIFHFDHVSAPVSGSHGGLWRVGGRSGPFRFLVINQMCDCRGFFLFSWCLPWRLGQRLWRTPSPQIRSLETRSDIFQFMVSTAADLLFDCILSANSSRRCALRQDAAGGPMLS